MKIVITGGAGFIGFRLAKRILEIGKLHGPSGKLEPVDEIVLFDIGEPPASLPRTRFVKGEIYDRDAVLKLIDEPNIGVFHLASVVSGGGELDFDLAMRVNLDGHLHVLEALRRLEGKARYVFASSVAAYGGSAMPKTVSDATRQTPQTTYGMTKAVGELLINDYSRKGFLDGRTARLATVIVRPGKPNKAASSFASAVIREPLNGIDYVLPVPLETGVPAMGYRTVVECLIALYELDGARLGDDRGLNLPNTTVTVGQMVESLQRIAGDRKLGKVSVAVDPFVKTIVDGWPTTVAAMRAAELGLPQEKGLDSIIKAYVEDYA